MASSAFLGFRRLGVDLEGVEAEGEVKSMTCVLDRRLRFLGDGVVGTIRLGR